jgi:hypothetical protein
MMVQLVSSDQSVDDGTDRFSKLCVLGRVSVRAAERVVLRSYIYRTGQLTALLYCCSPAFVDVGGKIGEMDAALGLLARLNPHDRQSDVAAERLAQELLDCKVPKKVAAHLLQRHDGLAVVLCH